MVIIIIHISLNNQPQTTGIGRSSTNEARRTRSFYVPNLGVGLVSPLQVIHTGTCTTWVVRLTWTWAI
jgi:hypothetical protein